MPRSSKQNGLRVGRYHSLIIVCARSSGLQSSDLPVLAFIVAPYLLLALMTAIMSERGTTA